MSFTTLYRLLIDPPAHVTNPSDRRRLRALSAAVLFLACATLGRAVIAGTPLWSATFFFWSGYLLTRTRYAAASPWTVLLGLYNISFIILFNPEESAQLPILIAYLWMFVGLLLGSVWLSITGNILNIVVLMLNLLALAWVKPELFLNSPAPLIAVEAAIFVFGVLATLVNTLYRLDQRDLKAQHAEIASQARELRKYFRAIEQSGSTIVITDTKGTIEYVNPYFESLTGYSSAEAVGQNPRVLKSGEHSPEFYKQLWDTITSGNVWRGELHNKRKDGSLFWESATIAPIFNRERVITNYVAIKEDITAAREMQERLRRQNHFFALLHRVTLDLLNRQNSENLLDIILERAGYLLDAPRGEILLKENGVMVARAFSKNQPYYLGQTFDATQAQLTWQVHDTRQTVVLNDYAQWPQRRAMYGPEMLHAVAGFPIFSGSECVGVLAVGRSNPQPFTPEQIETGELFAHLATLVLDHANLYASALQEIEQRKQTEQQLAIARDQALEASRFKSHLLAKVSHELRTPLGAAIGYAELVQNELLGPVNAEQRSALTNVIDSGNYLNLMIGELLDQAQIEARTVKLHIAPFAPADLLESVMSTMSMPAKNKNLPLKSSLAPDLPRLVRGDSKRIQQVLINLVGNAIKFTRSGEVRIDLLRVDETRWALRVSDTGSGIPPEAQKMIFEPFRQMENAITGSGRGVGLGLSITQQLVDLMQGQITLESEVNQGSIFTVILPIGM